MDATIVNAAEHDNYRFRCVLKGVLSVQCMLLVVVWGHVF